MSFGSSDGLVIGHSLMTSSQLCEALHLIPVNSTLNSKLSKPYLSFTCSTLRCWSILKIHFKFIPLSVQTVYKEESPSFCLLS